MSAEAFGVTLSGAASGADLGGSSKHSVGSPEVLGWIRVPRQLRLNEDESVLSLRATPF